MWILLRFSWLQILQLSKSACNEDSRESIQLKPIPCADELPNYFDKIHLPLQTTDSVELKQ